MEPALKCRTGDLRIPILLFLIFATPVVAAAELPYWGIAIPVMERATNVVHGRNREKAILKVSYDIQLENHKEPVSFYNSFFRKIGWEHHMKETYEKYPKQFDEPPMQKWSSFAATTESEKYGLTFGAFWQNQVIGSNAAVSMRVSGLVGDQVVGKTEVTLSPNVDGSPFLELLELIQQDPKAFLRLSELAGGDPFQIQRVDIERVRAFKTNDELFLRYIEAVDSVMSQIERFSRLHVYPE